MVAASAAAAAAAPAGIPAARSAKQLDMEKLGPGALLAYGRMQQRTGCQRCACECRGCGRRARVCRMCRRPTAASNWSTLL